MAGYGFGIWVSERVVNHKKFTLADRPGAIWGTRTRLERIPEEDITIVLLTNVQTANIDDMQSEIIKALVNNIPFFCRCPSPRLMTGSPRYRELK